MKRRDALHSRAPIVGDRLALYGSLMLGLGAMEELGVASQLRFLGACAIEGQLFDLGAYPAMKKSPGRIVAELFSLLDPKAIEVLDRFEGFEPQHPDRSLYRRERTPLIEPHATQAWVYVYVDELDAALRIAGGDWRAHLASRGHD